MWEQTAQGSGGMILVPGSVQKNVSVTLRGVVL